MAEMPYSKPFSPSMHETDELRLAHNAEVQKLLASVSEAKEEVVLSKKLTKVNRKGAEQQRVLLLTTAAIYNLKPGTYSKCRRRIALSSLQSISSAKMTSDFVFHVFREYDYHYKSVHRTFILSVIQRVYFKLMAKELEIREVSLKDLTDSIVTKVDAQRMAADRSPH